MRRLLQLGLLSSLFWSAVGCCCCYDSCYNYCCGYGSTGYNYATNYDTVTTGGYTSAGQTVTQHGTSVSSVGSQNNVIAYTPQGTVVSPQTTVGATQFGNNCPCATTTLPAGTFIQDANGNQIPFEGMVFDGTTTTSPILMAPGAVTDSTNTTVEKKNGTVEENSTVPPAPGKLIPAPQAKIGIPTGADGRPLVPPADE